MSTKDKNNYINKRHLVIFLEKQIVKVQLNEKKSKESRARLTS